MADETYNGWTNRETWAVALHINNDQGWQESVYEALREARLYDEPLTVAAGRYDVPAVEARMLARDIIRENVESVLSGGTYGVTTPIEALTFVQHVLPVINDIGSLWRVNWTELGEAFLQDISD